MFTDIHPLIVSSVVSLAANMCTFLSNVGQKKNRARIKRRRKNAHVCAGNIPILSTCVTRYVMYV